MSNEEQKTPLLHHSSDESEFESDWQKEVRVLTIRAAETSWPLTAFCCFFFVFVEVGNGATWEHSRKFYLLDFGAGLFIMIAHLLRKHIKYPLAVVTYGTSVLVTLVATIAAVMSSADNVFTYFIIVSLITVIRGLLYCQKISTVSSIALFSHLFIVVFTVALRPEPYFSLPNIMSTNIIELFMIMFALSGANTRYKLTKSNFLNSRRIEHASIVIQDKNRDILDSINYAQRIQTSLLASRSMLSSHLKEYFILFKPKDIVSGDFYWATGLESGAFAIAVADSTGHGVPGAIMSMLNISCLNESVNALHLQAPDEILNATRQRIMEHMANDGSDEGGKDGMDAVLACFDFSRNKLSFAAANNPLWLVRDGSLTEYQPDKMPVGKSMGELKSFTRHDIDLKKGDLILMITDGYADQFGGTSGKKFMYKPLKELILKHSTLPLTNLHEVLDETFESWRGGLEQVDDVLIFGVRV